MVDVTDIAVESVVSPARAREELTERARLLYADLGRSPSPRERFWFIADARKDGLYVRGESSPLLAGLWGIGTNTVERSACEVETAMADPAALDQARQYVAEETRRRSDEIYERARTASDQYAGALYTASNGAMETHGKVTGAIAPAGAINILVNAQGQLKPEVRAVFEASDEDVMGACERAVVACGWDLARFQTAVAIELEGSR